MKIHVAFLNDEHTKARITITPGWLGRLFGARPKSGEAQRYLNIAYGPQWLWSTTKREVKYEQYGRAVLRALELQDVEPLPRALLVERTRCACDPETPADPLHELGKVEPIAFICRTCGLRRGGLEYRGEFINTARRKS